MAIRIPVLAGVIKRRLLVNFRAQPEVVQRFLPPPFEPKLHRGHAVVGICLIRLEQIRPRSAPALLGISSENAAHRIAVKWTDSNGKHEGVFVPRRDTGSLLNQMAGGRIFPGEHYGAKFSVVDANGHIDFSMQSNDGSTSVRVVAQESERLPASSCFSSLAESSAFFEGGCVGYSVTRESTRFDGLLLRTLDWRVRALSVERVKSSFFDDKARFPSGSIEFDHALIMRDVRHEWHKADDLHSNAAIAGR
jgi:hypothetical protein